MGINKIIREEMDDMSWIDNISSTLTIYGLIGYYFTYPPSNGDKKFYITETGINTFYGPLGIGYSFKGMGEFDEFTFSEEQFVSYVNDDTYELYDQDGNRVLSHTLVMSEDSNINESDDFDWAGDVTGSPLTNGVMMFISSLGTNHKDLLQLRKTSNSRDSFNILEITNISDEWCTYKKVLSSKGWRGGAGKTDILNAKNLIKDGYWRVLDKVPKEILNSERTEAKDVLPYVIVDGNKNK